MRTPSERPGQGIECRAVTRATLVRLFAAILVLTAVIAVPMTQIHWDGTQASTQADKIDTLLNVMIVLSSFVFAIVLVMLGYCIWKYRAKPGDESDGEPIHGNTKLEIAWTVIPTVIVLFGAIYSWIVLGRHRDARPPDALPINVTAQQYKWTFNYPLANGKVVSSNELVVPDGRQLELHLTSLDVIHSFWVPEWRIKRDLVPAGPGGNDIDNTVVVTPDRRRHLQRGLHGALRVRPRDHARAGPGRAAERVRDRGSHKQPPRSKPAAGTATGVGHRDLRQRVSATARRPEGRRRWIAFRPGGRTWQRL